MNMRELLERAQRTGLATGVRVVLFDQKFLWFHPSVVAVAVAAQIDGQLVGVIGESSWGIYRAASFGDASRVAKLLALLGG